MIILVIRIQITDLFWRYFEFDDHFGTISK